MPDPMEASEYGYWTYSRIFSNSSGIEIGFCMRSTYPLRVLILGHSYEPL